MLWINSNKRLPPRYQEQYMFYKVDGIREDGFIRYRNDKPVFTYSNGRDVDIEDLSRVEWLDESESDPTPSLDVQERAKELYPYPEEELYNDGTPEGNREYEEMCWVVCQKRDAYTAGALSTQSESAPIDKGVQEGLKEEIENILEGVQTESGAKALSLELCSDIASEIIKLLAGAAYRDKQIDNFEVTKKLKYQLACTVTAELAKVGIDVSDDQQQYFQDNSAEDIIDSILDEILSSDYRASTLPIPSDIVEKLEKANPHVKSFHRMGKHKDQGYVDCLSKLRELLQAHPETLTVKDYEDVIADHKRLAKELDVLLNGKGAAENPSLCDIVSQVKKEGIKREDKK